MEEKHSDRTQCATRYGESKARPQPSLSLRAARRASDNGSAVFRTAAYLLGIKTSVQPVAQVPVRGASMTLVVSSRVGAVPLGVDGVIP